MFGGGFGGQNFGGAGGGAGAPTPPFGSSGFGAPASNNGTFGSSPPASFGAPFGGGGSTSGLGTSFGSSPNVITGGFGQQPTPASGFGDTNTNFNSSGFGGSNSSSGFGGGFGSVGGGGGGFNNPSSAGNSSSGQTFGGAAQSGPFGNSSSSPPATFGTSFGNPNPFGGTQQGASSTGVTFGASSNVVTANHQTHGGAAPNSTTSAWGAPTMYASNPFGVSNNNNNDSGISNDYGMQQQSDNEDMADGTTSPFGFPKYNDKGRGALGRLDEEVPMTGGLSPIPPSKESTGEEKRIKDNMQEKKRLQEKIEEKKKKLLERKLKKNQSKEALLNANATPFMPPSSDASLADRNAMRFAQHLDPTPPPPTTQSQYTSDYSKAPDSQQGDKGDRTVLENAVSLEGTCQNMCPDDELLRREREGDIQLLETPQPGTLHPPNWTLRDTAVKRFRRSAADYKLDVPEWVRPAAVLEKTVGYIEEWIMERDRQGPDPRFPQGQTPPSLDVYQFVWDRTRMIRKDFTLQNYVGTGGNCDAPAVRCHERIARWHAMCEHQLSHISDFITAQSSQNIQELMQTMQSLNQFYDDSLNRSTVEVPDEHGNELMTKQVGLLHGCANDGVQGKCPTDYDGTVLQYSAEERSTKVRLIGNLSVGQTGHGTAEPELRGMYILLTMNTDGGMEVLKYAAKLYQQRPKIYHSKPIQLALSIYKAKREYNYARFFSILKSPSTPYLFSCLMFKHVELMRKAAFRIMSKTFGARKKDTGEAIYDAYPLTRLVELLCFESIDEARAACKHYNITVKEMKMTSSSDPSRSGIAEIIFWRNSDFKEPKNPTKGTIIPLHPWKMVRTIERKLKGATRLAVCRGDVSGEGAVLPDNSHSRSALGTGASEGRFSSQDVAHGIAIAPSSQSAADLLGKQQQEHSRLEAEARLKDEADEARRLQEKQEQKAAAEQKAAELRLKIEHQKRLEEEKKRAIEEKQRQAEMERQRKAAKEKLELERKQKLEEERLRKKEEEARAALELKQQKEAEERRLRLEAEASRRAEEAELARRQEAEQRERELKRQQAEALKIKQEQERIRKEAEVARQKMIKIQEENRKRREAAERKKKKEWQERVDAARKKVIWLRWRCIVGRRLEMTKASRSCLRDIDPTFSNRDSDLAAQFHRAVPEYQSDSQAVDLRSCRDARQIFERLLKNQGPDLNLARMTMNELLSPAVVRRPSYRSGRAKTEKSTLVLLKLCVTAPEATTIQEESICDLAVAWVSSRLNCGRILVEKSKAGNSPPIEVRAVVSSSFRQKVVDADMELFLVPPPWTALNQDAMWSSSASSKMDVEIPRVALALGEDPDSQNVEISNPESLSVIYPSGLSEDAFENALFVACKNLVKKFVQEAVVYIDRILPSDMSTIVMREALWAAGQIEPSHNGNAIIAYARYSLMAMGDQISKLHLANETNWSLWPPAEFADGHSVPNYFSNEGRLPLRWGDHLSRKSLEANIGKCLLTLEGTFREVIERLLVRAPKSVHDECYTMIGRRQFRRCLERALLWSQQHRKPRGCDNFFYFPRGLLELVVENTLATLRDDGGSTGSIEGCEFVASESIDNTNTSDMRYEHAKIIELDEDLPHHELQNEIPRFAAAEPFRPSSETGPPGKRSFAEIVVQDGTPEAPSMAIIEKRPRGDRHSELSLNQRESLEFTQKLESLLRGDTVDMSVGKSTLAELLLDVPKL